MKLEKLSEYCKKCREKNINPKWDEISVNEKGDLTQKSPVSK